MLPPLEERAKDIAFSQGILEGWLDKVQNVPPAILEHLRTITEGVSYWRSKYFGIQQDYETLNANYTNLTVTYGQALQQMQFIRDQNTELLIEQQKDLHVQH
jgi:hypothetical protein